MFEPGGTLEALRQELSGHASGTEDGDQGSERVFRRLLGAIVSLELEPGKLLSERELMEAAQAGRASLRPAVIRLSELGLIRSLPRKGLVIASLDALDAPAIYEARWAIETRVARLAATRARDQDIDTLEALAHHPIEDSDDQDAWRTFLVHDQALHLGIAAAAQNQYLYGALTRTLPLASRMWHWVYGRMDVSPEMRFGHEDIVAAIRARDPDAAERAVESHIDQSQRVLRDVLVHRLGGAR